MTAYPLFSELVFVDTETTGLDPSDNHVWEVALIEGSTGHPHLWHINWEFGWRMMGGAEPTVGAPMSDASPLALSISGYYRRHGGLPGNTPGMAKVVNPRAFAQEFVRLTMDKHLVGMGPAFDDKFLIPLMNAGEEAVMWHYHLIDVEAMILGWLAGAEVDLPIPWKSTDLSLLLGVDPERFARHTALGDAMWARAVYAKMVGVELPEDERGW